MGEGRVDAGETDELWRRAARPVDVPIVAEALFGLPPEVVDATCAVKVCIGAEAAAVLAALPALSRALTTSVSCATTRARGEIRGPVSWSETMAARASSFGAEDLYICSVPQRDYDTPANRALVQALQTLAQATARLDRAPTAWRGDPRLRRARAVSRAARDWLEHPTLAKVSRGRVSRREMERVRSGKAAARYASVLALLEVAAEPLGPAQLLPLADRRTRADHALLVALVHELEGRGMVIPPWRPEGRAVLAGPITYVNHRHRRRDGRQGVFLGTTRIETWDSTTAGDTTPSDVAAMVDRAVRAARHLLVVDATGSGSTARGPDANSPAPDRAGDVTATG